MTRPEAEGEGAAPYRVELMLEVQQGQHAARGQGTTLVTESADLPPAVGELAGEMLAAVLARLAEAEGTQP